MTRISPLRQRFIDDMNLAGLVPGTQETTIRAVLTCVLCAAAKETRCGNISPERITEEQLATYIRQRHPEMARGTFQTEFIPKPVEKPATMLCGSPFSHKGAALLQPATRVNGRAFGKPRLVVV